ncbi:CCA tRNA nucleotidyltransferase [Pontivivens ytuae]|uniref:CCA tRNA nucleotidyltransferase n=1 Tax=Pontivivens ytuae TaxID=2789856 RepID=A0A7S9LUC0_9RHOB|nr:CCA tRNA nucleotidyltransferase [Pontivivens ytuae]QPH55316.1 CCA tRNA nucleotidyltransferase [Pontivivens ytuae]
MHVEGSWRTTPATVRVMSVLGEAYFVGGCVRNAVLGEPVSDIDIATPLRPEEVVARMEAAELKVVPTGIEHGTVTVVADSVPYEVTTFRRDVETDGRRATIAFADDIAEDAARRDFTMNALYARADGEVVDPLGGLEDARARRVIFVGDAETRIREDYLRILRFFRFRAWYGRGEADETALAACTKLANGLDGLSAERVTAEFCKLLAAPDPTPVLEEMVGAGVLKRVLPDAQLDLIAPLIRAEDGRAPRWQRRMLALSGRRSRLRLAKRDAQGLILAEAALARPETPAVRARRYGSDIARDLCLMEAAILGRKPSRKVEAEIARGAAASFPLKAADLMPPFSPGPELGVEMERLRTLWHASDLKHNKAALLRQRREPGQRRGA